MQVAHLHNSLKNQRQQIGTFCEVREHQKAVWRATETAPILRANGWKVKEMNVIPMTCGQHWQTQRGLCYLQSWQRIIVSGFRQQVCVRSCCNHTVAFQWQCGQVSSTCFALSLQMETGITTVIGVYSNSKLPMRLKNWYFCRNYK